MGPLAEGERISPEWGQACILAADSSLKNPFLFSIVYTSQVEKPLLPEKGWFHFSLKPFPQPAHEFT